MGPNSRTLSFNKFFAFVVHVDYVFFLFPCRHLYLQDKARVTCATFHKPNRILITGFTNGVFTLHEMPEFHPMHSLRYLLSFIIIRAIYLSLPLFLLFSFSLLFVSILPLSFPTPPLPLSPSPPQYFRSPYY